MPAPQKHSSSYYGMWGFRDWALSDDERLFAILSGYKYTYSSTAPTTYHRVLEFDVSRDDVWTCMDSYDVSPQFGEYTAIAYDTSDGTFWIVYNAQRRTSIMTLKETVNTPALKRCILTRTFSWFGLRMW